MADLEESVTAIAGLQQNAFPGCRHLVILLTLSPSLACTRGHDALQSSRGEHDSARKYLDSTQQDQRLNSPTQDPV